MDSGGRGGRELGPEARLGRADRIAWREIDGDRCGLVGTDDAEGVRGLLERFFALAPEEKAAMGRRARETFDRRFEIRASARSLLETIERLRAG